MDVTIVTTTEIVHANDMIFLPNLMICSHNIMYIVLVHHLYALTLCMSEMLNI